MFKRIIVVGTSGSGKTTLVRQIANKLKLTQIELDSLFWDKNWTYPTDGEFKRRVTSAMQDAEKGWVMDGNYSKVRDLTWQEADTVIWLDYPLWLIYYRIFTRTLKRVFTREKLWNGNRERFRDAFLSKDSIIWWAHTTYARRKALYPELMLSEDYRHLAFVRFTSPSQTSTWLNSLQDAQ